MLFRTGYDLLEHLLRNEPLTEGDLVAFLSTKPSDEGLHVEYKNGAELKKPKKERTLTIRQYVTAFANSDGGVLVNGVENTTKALAPIMAPEERDLGKDL